MTDKNEHTHPTKFFIQLQHKCSECGRTVDVVSTNTQPGLIYSCHFVSKDQIKFCVNSFTEFVR